MAEEDQEDIQDEETQMTTECNGRLRIALERLLWRYPLLGGKGTDHFFGFIDFQPVLGNIDFFFRQPTAAFFSNTHGFC